MQWTPHSWLGDSTRLAPMSRRIAHSRRQAARRPRLKGPAASYYSPCLQRESEDCRNRICFRRWVKRLQDTAAGNFAQCFQVLFQPLDTPLQVRDFRPLHGSWLFGPRFAVAVSRPQTPAGTVRAAVRQFVAAHRDLSAACAKAAPPEGRRPRVFPRANTLHAVLHGFRHGQAPARIQGLTRTYKVRVNPKDVQRP